MIVPQPSQRSAQAPLARRHRCMVMSKSVTTNASAYSHRPGASSHRRVPGFTLPAPVEQRLRVFEVLRVETFGEPAVDRRKRETGLPFISEVIAPWFIAPRAATSHLRERFRGSVMKAMMRPCLGEMDLPVCTDRFRRHQRRGSGAGAAGARSADGRPERAARDLVGC